MSEIKESMMELIGKTPLLRLNRYMEKSGIKDAVILGKLEYLNPAGSVKDRITLAMVEDVEKSGRLRPGATSLSIGTENIDDILKDLENAFRAIV